MTTDPRLPRAGRAAPRKDAMKTIRETHRGAGPGDRRVSHLEAEGAHLTVAQIQQFLDVAPDDALVSVGYEYSDRLGCVGKSRVSVEWIEETR